MNRRDWYLLALGTLQVALVFHVIGMIKTGTVVSMTGQLNADGYIAIILLLLSVLAPLKNLARILTSVTKDVAEDASNSDLLSIGRWTLSGIVAIVALEFVQSLTLLNLYSGY